MKEYGKVFSLKFLNQGAIAENPNEWFMVHGYEQISAPQDEVATSLKGFNDCQGLALDGCISGLGIVREPRPDKRDLPAILARWGHVQCF